MHKRIFVKVTILSAIGVLGFISPSSATWPTLDMSAIQPTIQNVQQEVQSVKQQIESCKELQKIKTAIGDAKEAASKFNEDVVQKAKKEAEKIKKEAEKVKKIQDDIKKAKEEYEKKKKEFAEYKQKLEETKAAVDSKIKEAQQMASDAQSAVEGAKGLASQAIADAQSQVGSVTSDISGTVGAVQNRVSNISASHTESTVDQRSNVGGNVALPQSRRGEIPSGTANDFSRTSFNLSGNGEADVGQVVSPIQNRTGGTAPAGVSMRERAEEYAMPLSVRESFVQEDILAEPAGITQESKEDKIVNPEIEAEVEDIKRIASEQGTDVATRLLKTSIDEAVRNKDIARLDALSKIETSDIINSNSKRYEETSVKAEGRRAFSSPIEEMSVEKLKKQALEAKENLRPTVEEKVTTPETKPISEFKVPAKTIENVEKAIIPAREQTITNAPVVSKVQAVRPQNVEVPSPLKAPIQGLQERKPFTMPTSDLEKNSFLIEEKKTAPNRSKLSFADTLRFASITGGECTDYNNVIQTKDGTVIIIPELLAKECCLKAENLTDLNLIRDCAKKLVIESKGLLEIDEASLENCGGEGIYDASSEQCLTRTDTMLGQEKLGVYNEIVAQQGANAAAEGIIDKAKASNYVKDFFEPYKEKIAKIQSKGGGDTSGSSNKDATSLLTLTNQQMMYLLNMIRRNYTTTLADISLRGLGSVTENAVLEDEKGVNSTQEYGNTVVRQEDAVVEYPILPENIAIKCSIKAKELGEDGFNQISQADPAITSLADCYRQVVKDINVTNETEIDEAQKFMQLTQYQENLNTLEKALYQKVKSSKYEETLDNAEETNNNATTTRKGYSALFQTETELARIADDMVNVYASKLTYTAIKALSKLETPTTPSIQKTGGTEG
ncbi:MAG: hypothetical protein IJ545_00585 [Alphaproteobacteria bacterium]|nr:hypothetical protein [Alphaproteobacteria bacterium]